MATRIENPPALSDDQYRDLRDRFYRELAGSPIERMAREVSESRDDIVQEAMTRLVADVKKKGRAPDSPIDWLYRTAQNYVINKGKSNKLHPTEARAPGSFVFEGQMIEATPEEQAVTRLSQAEYRHMRNSLERNQAALVLLRDAGFTVREAAEILKLPKSTCQDNLQSALDDLSKQWNARHGKVADRRIRKLAVAIVAGTLSKSERARAAEEMSFNVALSNEVKTLRRSLHEVATLIPVQEALSQQATGTSLMEKGASLVDKARETAYSLSGTSQGTESTAGVLAGAGQKVAAVCAAGAAATCVGAAGVVGPGVGGVDVVKGDEEKPAIERPASIPAPVRPVTEQPVDKTQEAEPVADPTPKPAEQAATEFGVESAGSSSGGGEFGGPSGGGGSGGGGGEFSGP